MEFQLPLSDPKLAEKIKQLPKTRPENRGMIHVQIEERLRRTPNIRSEVIGLRTGNAHSTPVFVFTWEAKIADQSFFVRYTTNFIYAGINQEKDIPELTTTREADHPLLLIPRGYQIPIIGPDFQNYDPIEYGIWQPVLTDKIQPIYPPAEMQPLFEVKRSSFRQDHHRVIETSPSVPKTRSLSTIWRRFAPHL